MVNERIKSRRTALGLTLQDVADHLGVKEATAQRYESGEIKNIKHETIQKLSNVLKCTPAYLLGWEDDISGKSTSLSNPNELEDLSEEQILTLAAHQVGHEGSLTHEQMAKVKLAMKIALAREEN